MVSGTGSIGANSDGTPYVSAPNERRGRTEEASAKLEAANGMSIAAGGVVADSH
jgi:hypothetical protein